MGDDKDIVLCFFHLPREFPIKVAFHRREADSSTRMVRHQGLLFTLQSTGESPGSFWAESERLAVAKDDLPTRQVIWRHAHTDAIAQRHANLMVMYVVTDLREHFNMVIQSDAKKAPLIRVRHLPIEFQEALPGDMFFSYLKSVSGITTDSAGALREVSLD